MSSEGLVWCQVKVIITMRTLKIHMQQQFLTRPKALTHKANSQTLWAVIEQLQPRPFVFSSILKLDSEHKADSVDW